MTKTLDAKGFVYRSLKGDVYWVAMYEGRPHRFRWDREEQRWTKGYPMPLSTVWALPRSMPADEQQSYHDRHLGCRVGRDKKSGETG